MKLGGGGGGMYMDGGYIAAPGGGGIGTGAVVALGFNEAIKRSAAVPWNSGAFPGRDVSFF